MAPKRGSTSKRPRGDTHDTNRFASQAAAEHYEKICQQPIVPERGFVNEPPFTTIISNLKWERFINAPTPTGSKALTLEFYSNLAAHPTKSTVFLRGQQIDVSPQAINLFYGLPNYEKDGLRQACEAGIDELDMMLVLTGHSQPPPVTWTFLPRGQLTREARTLYYFVAARLMPTVVNSYVQKTRAFLTYVLLKGLTVDVGYLVHDEMLTILGSHDWHSMGFPALIHGLAIAQGIVGPSLPDGPLKQPIPVSLALIDRASKRKTTSTSQADPRGEEETAQPSREDPPVIDRLAVIESQITTMRGDITSIQSGLAALHTMVDDNFAAVLARLPPPTLE